MKVTFLVPPAVEGKAPERLFGCNVGVYFQPNIFMLYPAAMLEKQGHAVSVLDCPVEKTDWETFEKFLRNDDSKAYVFYTVFLSEEVDKRTHAMIRGIKKDVPIIFIGPEPTTKPAAFLLDDSTFVIRGEPEYTIVELVKELSSVGRRINKIAGLSWKFKGKDTDNPMRPFPKNYDDVPFPSRHLIKKELYYNPKLQGRPSTVILTSRTCWGRCKYCCHPDDVVETADGFQKISEVKGTSIRTLDGTLHEVKEHFINNFEGNMVEIIPRFVKFGIHVTPNHNIFVFNKDRKTLEKKCASALTTDDYIFIPIPNDGINIDKIKISDIIPNTICLKRPILLGHKKLTNEKIELMMKMSGEGICKTQIAKDIGVNRETVRAYVNKLHKDKSTLKLLKNNGMIKYSTGKYWINDSLALDSDMLRLFGYYISEGCVSKNPRRVESYTVSFTFNRKERGYIEDVKNIIKTHFKNINIGEIHQDNITRIVIVNAVLGKLFEACGTSSSNKKIPEFLYRLPHTSALHVVEGIKRGDGNVHKGTTEIATSSEILARQLANVILRGGILPSIDVVKNDQGRIDGRKIKGGNLYRIRYWEGRKRKYRLAERIDGGFAVKIKMIKEVSYKGPVYNFHVDKDHSYVSNFVAISNCIPCSYSFAREIEYKRHFGKKPLVGLRSAKNVIAEFRQLKAEGYNAVAVIDDNFVNGKDRTIAICNGIKELGLEWGCLTRADAIKDPEIVKAMAEAGCRYVDLGVESFDQKVLDYIHKDMTVEDNIRAINLLRQYGITPKVNILFGASPYETEESIRRTVETAKKLDLDYISFGVVIPHPQTEYYKDIKAGGMFATESKDFEAVDPIKQATIDLPHISQKRLQEMVKWAYRSYYLRPSYAFRMLKKVKSFKQLKENASTLWNLVR